MAPEESNLQCIELKWATLSRAMCKDITGMHIGHEPCLMAAFSLFNRILFARFSLDSERETIG